MTSPNDSETDETETSPWFSKAVLHHARRVVVAVIGGTLILIGLALLVLPGPGWLTIFLGLAVLASEFVWARWLMRKARQSANVVGRQPWFPQSIVRSLHKTRVRSRWLRRRWWQRRHPGRRSC